MIILPLNFHKLKSNLEKINLDENGGCFRSLLCKTKVDLNIILQKM